MSLAEIYFVRSGDAIKIGHTTDLSRRMGELQVGSPHELVLELSVHGTPEQEHQLHKQFESARIRGEWYRPAKELLDLIDALREGARLSDYLTS